MIEGDRNKTYGSPTQNFQNTADIWNVLLAHKLKDGAEITATEVATLMIALKLARTIAQPKRDNFVDIAGYAACGWEAQADCTGETKDSDTKPVPGHVYVSDGETYRHLGVLSRTPEFTRETT